MSEGKEIRRPLQSKSGLKKYIRLQYLKNHLSELLKRKQSKYNGFNILELGYILKHIKIPKSEQLNAYRSICEDIEFLMAFNKSKL